MWPDSKLYLLKGILCYHTKAVLFAGENTVNLTKLRLIWEEPTQPIEAWFMQLVWVNPGLHNLCILVSTISAGCMHAVETVGSVLTCLEFGCVRLGGSADVGPCCGLSKPNITDYFYQSRYRGTH